MRPISKKQRKQSRYYNWKKRQTKKRQKGAVAPMFQQQNSLLDVAKFLRTVFHRRSKTS